MSSKVIELNDENFADVLAENSLVVVDFWAPWCGPCRMLSPIIEELAEEGDDQYAVCKLDIDENSTVSIGFGIRSIPIIIIFKDAIEVERIMGLTSKSTIKDAVKKHLDK